MPRVEQLEGEEEEEDLGGPRAAVHKVTVEQVLMEEDVNHHFSAFRFEKIVEVSFDPQIYRAVTIGRTLLRALMKAANREKDLN